MFFLDTEEKNFRFSFLVYRSQISLELFFVQLNSVRYYLGNNRKIAKILEIAKKLVSNF